MLIKALCDYFDMRDRRGENKLPYYCSEQKVSHAIMLTPDGELKDIIDIRYNAAAGNTSGSTGKKLESETIYLPWRSQKSDIDLNIVEHRAQYIFGLNYVKGVFTTDDKTDKAKKAHECFAKGNLEFCAGLTSDIVRAYCKFIEGWVPAEQTQNEVLLKLGKDYANPNTYFCFALDGHPEIKLHEDPELMAKYAVEFNKSEELKGRELTRAMCAIEGEVLPIEKTHDKIIGVYKVKNNRGAIVSFNEIAFESYGREQSENSNISRKAMKKYTYALNRLLAEKNHHTLPGDTTVVFFAMSENDSIGSDCLLAAMNGTPEERLEGNVKTVISEMRRGRAGATELPGVDTSDIFYIAGLAPNAARISVQFVLRNEFGKIMDNIMQHQRDLAVKENGPQIAVSRILKELCSPKAKEPVVPTSLSSAIMRSVFSGTNYPQQLLATTVRRVKTDSDIIINDIRAGIIKACLNRKARLSGKEEMFQMTPDFENKSDAFHCGRLFALLEYIQRRAADTELNKTIKDAYFSSACSRPASVFPGLIKLSQHHMAKIKRNTKYDYNRAVGEIINRIQNGFPVLMTLDEQGEFIIGYYNQNTMLYTPVKKEAAGTTAAADASEENTQENLTENTQN